MYLMPQEYKAFHFTVKLYETKGVVSLIGIIVYSFTAFNIKAKRHKAFHCVNENKALQVVY